MEHLTSEQQKLVENNHNLIYGLAKKNKINLDEYYDILAIGLCKAAIQFDETRGQFSTFAYKTMLHEYFAVLRHNKTNCVISDNIVVSMNVEVGNENDSPVTLGDTIATDEDMEGNIVSESYVSFLCSKLSQQQDRDIVMLLADGMSQVEIAKNFGVSRQYIGQRINKIRARLGKFVA